MQAAVQDIQIGLLHVGRRYASRRGYLVEAVAGCGDAEVAVVLVHGELVQNMARHSTRRLIADACTINTDPVHSSLFDLTPDCLNEIDLGKRDVDFTARAVEQDWTDSDRRTRRLRGSSKW